MGYGHIYIYSPCCILFILIYFQENNDNERQNLNIINIYVKYKQLISDVYLLQNNSFNWFLLKFCK